MSSIANRAVGDIARQGSDRGGRSSPYSRSGPSSRAPTEDKWKHDMFEGHSNGGRYVKSQTPTQKLLIEGLHYEVSEDELKTLFSEMGPIQRSFIKYDRSGRSTGVAIVVYQAVEDAIAARSEFDGANAKGQPITISYEQVRGPRGGPAGNGDRSRGQDLRSRMDLMSRLGGENTQAPPNAPKGPSAGSASTPPSQRNSRSQNNVRGVNSDSNGSGRRGGRANTAQAPRGSIKRTPKTASDLDAELDAFMKAPPSTAAMAESVHAPQPGADGDVEMQ